MLRAIEANAAGHVSSDALEKAYDDAVRDTVQRFEATGSPIVTDGEQRKSSFATYPLEGLTNLAPDGVVIPFQDGHTRRLPRLSQGPFRYGKYAGEYVRRATPVAHRPLKQAVISASALSLLYPLDRFGTTDDCGSSPFADDTSTARDTAFAKINARVEGTAMAAAQLGV